MPTYCKVKRTMLAQHLDGWDADTLPESAPLHGNVTFTPQLADGDAVTLYDDGKPVTIVPAPIKARISDGQIFHRGVDYIELLAGGDRMNPATLVWKAAFTNLQASGVPVKLRPVIFEAVPDGTVDLTVVAPAPGTAGQGIVKGRDGDTIDSLAVEGADLVLRVRDGDGVLRSEQIAIGEVAKAVANDAVTRAETARQGAELAKSDAVTNKNAAVDAALTAGNHATAASNSAGTSTTQANRSKTEADRAATSAQQAADVAAAGMPDATTSAKGKVKLAGDLGGTADAPTVPGLAGKADLVGGQVPTSQLPAVALTKPSLAADRAALLAMDAQEGDVAVISSGADKGTYMLGQGAPTAFASWVKLVSPDAPVQAVNGQTGTVNLDAANVGAAPVSHTHTVAQVTGLQAALDGKAATTAMNSRPALFSGDGAPPAAITGAVVGDWWLNTTTMELSKITGV